MPMSRTEIVRSASVDDFDREACSILRHVVAIRSLVDPSLHTDVVLRNGRSIKLFPSDCYLRRSDAGDSHWITIGIEETCDGEDVFVAIEVNDISSIACDIPEGR